MQCSRLQLSYLLLLSKDLRWQAAYVVHNGHSYDQNNLGEGVLFCLYQQTGKDKTL